MGCFTLGAYKQFMMNEIPFFHVGIDLVAVDGEEWINIKVLFSFFR
jgi:hypothetical protein